MPKTVLCVDLGNVIVTYNPTELKKLLKRAEFKAFLELIKQHDTNLPTWHLHKSLNASGAFRRYVGWVEFFKAYDDAVDGVNQQMVDTLWNIKNSGRARLVCITDNNPLCFFATTRKFPEVFKLFREGDNENWIISHLICSLKTSGVPFIRAASEFGFSLKEACLVDDMPNNHDAFIGAGAEPGSGFLCNLRNKRNHAKFEKFLEKHFPAKSQSA